MLFELASVLSGLAGTSNVVFASPQRYSTIRIRQIEATFGFEQCRRHRTSHATMVEPEQLPVRRRDRELRSCRPCRPSARAACTTSSFPFWVPDRIVEERGNWLAGYDEIWAYSEFVRRNVNGLIRHYGLDGPADPAASRPTPCGPGADQRPSLARASDHPDRGALLHRAATTSVRTS